MASSGYQTGIGTPKNLCLEINQSPVKPLTQFSYRTRMKSGTKFSSLPKPISRSLRSESRPPFFMYHWRVETISRGLSPFSKNLTSCVIGFGSPIMSPDSWSNSTILCFAENVVLPTSSANTSLPRLDVIASGISSVIRPSQPKIARFGRSSSRHQIMSVTSPKVQIMAIPEPLSI
ncbi:unannotated protein [freshwater metagenome]|uniref:Unannotated protein n=1 Tax=freshwater metagenome TaxID=449393 RepID=A0A6J6CRD4_9ZZZZ